VRAGDHIDLKPGDIRELPMPLWVTGSIEVQVLLAAGENLVPRSGIEIVLRNSQGREVTRAVPDFAGFALFEGLALGEYSTAAGERARDRLVVSQSTLDHSVTLVLPAS
jgi:hypothetical protein